MLYSGRGSILGTAQFASPSGASVSGTLDWLRLGSDYSLGIGGTKNP